MADVYCDQTLATGLDDGTSWANAYKLLSGALDGGISVVAGDDLWVKNDASIAAQTTIWGLTVWSNNPPRVWAVKSATTNEPPVQSDLIPGWRTGEARTNANRAYEDADGPSLTITGTGNDLQVRGLLRLYGLQLLAADNVVQTQNTSEVVYEECLLSAGVTEKGDVSFGKSTSCKAWLLNSKCIAGNAGKVSCNAIGSTHYKGVIIDSGDVIGQLHPDSNYCQFDGCDFTAQTTPVLKQGGGGLDRGMIFRNSQINASSALVAGTIAKSFRSEFYNTANVTGKSSGTIQNVDILTHRGTITEETTAVRTGGADDGGDGGWALAFTPYVDSTLEQHGGIEGPPMYVEVTAGASKTITVYIANSGAADYNDDDVWLEVFYPSEAGTAQFDNITTQMDFLGTPTVVADDTGSTWGTGGDNHQKLVVTVSPDYIGIAYCRVVFAKRFASSPETLYVDPQPVYA